MPTNSPGIKGASERCRFPAVEDMLRVVAPHARTCWVGRPRGLPPNSLFIVAGVVILVVAHWAMVQAGFLDEAAPMMRLMLTLGIPPVVLGCALVAWSALREYLAKRVPRNERGRLRGHRRASTQIRIAGHAAHRERRVALARATRLAGAGTGWAALGARLHGARPERSGQMHGAGPDGAQDGARSQRNRAPSRAFGSDRNTYRLAGEAKAI